MSNVALVDPGLAPTREELSYGLFAHISFLAGMVFPFGNVLGPLVVLLAKGGTSPYVAFHARQSLVFQAVTTGLTFSLIFRLFPLAVEKAWVALVATCVPLLAVVLANLVLPIVQAIRASRGSWSRYPVTGGLGLGASLALSAVTVAACATSALAGYTRLSVKVTPPPTNVRVQFAPRGAVPPTPAPPPAPVSSEPPVRALPTPKLVELLCRREDRAEEARRELERRGAGAAPELAEAAARHAGEEPFDDAMGLLESIPRPPSSIARSLAQIVRRGEFGPNGVSRRAALVLVRIGPEEAFAGDLIRALEDPEVRSDASAALERLAVRSPAHVASLLGSAVESRENPAAVREAAIRLLGDPVFAPHGAIERLSGWAGGALGVPALAAAAAEALTWQAEGRIPTLARDLQSNHAPTRAAAARKLGVFGAGAKSLVPLVARVAVFDNVEEVRVTAADALGRIGIDAPEAEKALRETLRDASPAVREAAGRALRALGKEP